LPIIGIISKIEFEISYLLNFFNNKYNIRIIYISFLQAFLSAIFSCIIAIPFALSLYRHKNSRIIKFIVSLCGYSFVLPSILVVYSVIGIYGINGLLNNLINFYNLLDIRTDGGRDGLEVPMRIIGSAKSRIKSGGKFIYVTSSLSDFKKLISYTKLEGFDVSILAKKKLFFEELILVKAVKLLS